MITVSILVPIYGVEKYIEKCAVSLFEQTYSNIEYVFVNDCTIDSSMSVLESVIEYYPHRRKQIHIITHQTNKGLAGARIAGLLAATGEYVFHVDSDDYISVDAIELLVKKAEETHADIVDAAYEKVCMGKTVFVRHPYSGNNSNYLHHIIARTGLQNNQIWGKLIKRNLYLDNAINAIEGINYAEDYAVFPKLLICANNRAVLNHVVYFYRDDNSSSYMHHISESALASYVEAELEIYNYVKNSHYSDSHGFSSDFGYANLYLFAYRNSLDWHLIEKTFQLHSNYVIINVYLFFLKSRYLKIVGHIIFKLIKKIKYSF